MSERTVIEVFADITCPFTYFGLRRLVAARAEANADVVIHVRAWPLEWINGEPLTADHVAHEIEALRADVAPDLFGGFDAQNFPRTSMPALGLAAVGYARDDATGEAVSLELRDALFERGLDIAHPSTVRSIAAEFGLVVSDAEETAASVLADWELGRARGVRGSPHFFVGDRDWFCPTLAITRARGRYEARIAKESMQDFYSTALV